MNFLRVILWNMMNFVQEALTWIVAGLKFSASFSIRSIEKEQFDPSLSMQSPIVCPP